MTFWETLGIEPSGDIAVIKRAYAARLKVTRPDDDAEAYQRLRQAYEFAQRHATFVRAREAALADRAGDASDAKSDSAHRSVTASHKGELAGGNIDSRVTLNAEPQHEQLGNSKTANAESSSDDHLDARPIAEPIRQHEAAKNMPLKPPRQPLLIHHRVEQPAEEPVKPAFSPASLVQATLEILRQSGPAVLEASWPSLQQQLYELPLSSRVIASSLFAQLVIEQDLPAGFVVSLANHFEWQTDFRVEQALGAQRADRLFTKLTLGMQKPSQVVAPPVRPQLVRHTVVFSQLLASKPSWWLWIFSVLAGARLPGEFLSMTDDEQRKLGISYQTKAAALAWLQRGMLVRTALVIGVLIWRWGFDSLLFGQGQPANLVLDVLPLAIVAFYLQAGLANVLQRRWTWPLPHAEQSACVLAIAAAVLMRVLHDPGVVASLWNDHISLWYTLVGALLVMAAMVAPPPARRDFAQMRLPIQFVLSFLLCRLIISASSPSADELELCAYAAGWLGINILIYPPIRKWMASVDSQVRGRTAGRTVGPLALCLAILVLFIPGFPSLLQEIARRTSQRLVFAAVAIALFLPSSQSDQAALTLLVLIIAAVLMFLNKLLRDYAFLVMTGVKRVDWMMVALALFLLVGLSSLYWSVQHQGQLPKNDAPAVSYPRSAHDNPPLAISPTLTPLSGEGKSIFAASASKPVVLAPYQVTVFPEEAIDTARSHAPEQHLLVSMLQNQIADWIGPLTVLPGASLRCQVEYSSNGSIVRYIVLRRSGDASFDEAVRQAIYRAAPLHLAPNLNKNEEPVRRVDVQVVAR